MLLEKSKLYQRKDYYEIEISFKDGFQYFVVLKLIKSGSGLEAG